MICVAICTRQRPEMLRRLLKTCAKITPDARSRLKFIIIENGEADNAESIADDFSDMLDITYLNEPRVGLVFARNAAIEGFLQTDANWMGVIDDDELISENWLIAMLDAIEAFPHCKVFAGPQLRLNPVEASRWLREEDKPNPKTGTANWDVSTANVMFQREVFSSDGLNLRFHPMFNLSGGEDTYLFYTLKDLGEDILWVQGAVCYEPTVIERSSAEFRAERIVQWSQNWGRLNMLRFGRFRGGWPVVIDLLTNSINFGTYSLSGLFISIINRDWGFKLMDSGLRFGFVAIGKFKALFLPLGTHYKDVIGK